MSLATIYDLGDVAALSCNFYSDADDTTLADPTSVTLSIRDPNRVVTTPTPTHDGTGVYTYTYTPTVPGFYEVSWVGTGSVASADQDAFYVRVGVTLGNLYISAAQLKSSLELTGTTYADADVALAVGASCRAVDSITGRRFWLDADAEQVRYYTPRARLALQIDDLVTLTSVAVDTTGDGSYDTTWTIGTDFVLEPVNGPSEQPARPYTMLRVRRSSGQCLPTWVEQSVKVTGRFGWSSVPDDITTACTILASKLLRRTREAPFGIVTAGIDQATAMRIGRNDPDVYTLLVNYDRHDKVG